LSDHVVSPKLYIAIFLALMVLTGVTVWAAGQDFGAYNTAVAVGIAVTKATLVILFFMHVRWAGKLVQLFVASGFIWLAILIAITLADYVSRGWSLTSAP
jgi:cytochrome c oxidase subunit 4